MWPAVGLLAMGTLVFLSPLFLGITGDTGVDASAIITGSLVVAFGVGGAVYSTAKPTTSVTPSLAKAPAPPAT
jgi:hypothetical protein